MTCAISVLMATHNGADTIDRTLAAMSDLDAPAGGWKLVIVNNGSTDDTESRVLKWRDRLPLEYVVESRLGKSRAMNTALEHAEGDLIVMTDDDVLPDRNWLTEWRRVADVLPQCSVFGGAIIPEFGETPPTWPMPKPWLTVLYAQTPDYEEGEIEPFNVSGPNMAIRKSVCDGGERFDENFLVGKYGLMGEDSEFIRRAWAHGHKVGFAPNARVRHIVHKDQMSWRWIHHRFFRHGHTMFMLEEVREDKTSKRLEFIFPRWRIRRAATSLLKLMLAAPTLNKKRIFSLSRSMAYDLGALRQAWLLSRQERPHTQGKD
jgi:glycosyltransferase involved in cell wall biosynthesis